MVGAGRQCRGSAPAFRAAASGKRPSSAAEPDQVNGAPGARQRSPSHGHLAAPPDRPSPPRRSGRAAGFRNRRPRLLVAEVVVPPGHDRDHPGRHQAPISEAQQPVSSVEITRGAPGSPRGPTARCSPGSRPPAAPSPVAPSVPSCSPPRVRADRKSSLPTCRAGHGRGHAAIPVPPRTRTVAACSSYGRSPATTTAGARDAATSATAFCPPWVTTTSAEHSWSHTSRCDGGSRLRSATSSPAWRLRPPRPLRRYPGRRFPRAPGRGPASRGGDGRGSPSKRDSTAHAPRLARPRAPASLWRAPPTATGREGRRRAS